MTITCEARVQVARDTLPQKTPDERTYRLPDRQITSKPRVGLGLGGVSTYAVFYRLSLSMLTPPPPSPENFGASQLQTMTFVSQPVPVTVHLQFKSSPECLILVVIVSRKYYHRVFDAARESELGTHKSTSVSCNIHGSRMKVTCVVHTRFIFLTHEPNSQHSQPRADGVAPRRKPLAFLSPRLKTKSSQWTGPRAYF